MPNDDIYVYHSRDGKNWKLQAGGPHKEEDIRDLKAAEGDALQRYWNTRTELRDRNPGLSVQLGYLIRFIAVPHGTPPPVDLPPLSHEEIVRQEIDPSWKK